MSFLLDSHTFLWALAEPEKLSIKVRAILEDPHNRIFVSAVTFWEISLKFSLGKLGLNGVRPNDLTAVAVEIGFEFLPLLPSEAAGYHQVNADWHRDPFDRMLIWQTITNDLTLLSKDRSVAQYRSIGLKLIW